MSFHIKRSKVEQDWHKRENQKKRVINTVIHMLNRATVRDLNTVLALINQNRNIDDIINLSVHEINLILPDLINTERRLTRLAIRQFNDLTEEAEVVFNDYYRRISDDVVTKNTNIMNGTTRLRTRDFLRKFIGAQDLDDAQKVRDALTQNISETETSGTIPMLAQPLHKCYHAQIKRFTTLRKLLRQSAGRQSLTIEFAPPIAFLTAKQYPKIRTFQTVLRTHLNTDAAVPPAPASVKRMTSSVNS